MGPLDLRNQNQNTQKNSSNRRKKISKNEMATSGKKASMGAAVGLIAAGAGIAAYYFLYLSKAKEDTPAEDIPDNNEVAPEEEPKEVLSNHNLVVTENIDDLQNEVDACGKTPPSTPVVEEMVTKKAAAAAFIGQKLNQNVHFQKFNQNKGLDVSKEVEVKETVKDVKEPEVIEKKSDSNIELVKVVASDIVTNLSPIVTKEQDEDHELVTSNLSSFVTVTNDNLQEDTNGATAQIDTEIQVNSVEEIKKRSISPEPQASKKVLKTSSPSPVKATSPVK